MNDPIGYTLNIEDMTHAGDSMGSAHTTSMGTKNFTTVDKAKAYALKHYQKNRPNDQIPWKKSGNGWTSGDLSWVMYDIKPIKFEG